MAIERRNLYRILHLQPEAPQAMIKASYRTLMSTLRAHPDLGGDSERAAQINAAYEVLSDPERRRAYDQQLRRSLRGRGGAASPAAPPPAPGPGARPAPASPPPDATDLRGLAAHWASVRRCPLCAAAFAQAPGAGVSCGTCGAPLQPAPVVGPQVPGEPLGRRRGPRVARQVDATVRLMHPPRQWVGVLADVSVTGLSLACMPAVDTGQVIRVTTDRFDALVEVVACRTLRGAHRVHARMVTLQLTAPDPAATYRR